MWIIPFAYGFWRINKELSFPGTWALVPVFGTSLLLLGGDKTWVNRILLSNQILIRVGLISFPLYLWHWPLLVFARILVGENPSLNIRIAVVGLSVLLAFLTYKLLERPLRFGKNGNTIVAILIFGMFIVGCIGYNTYSRDGLKFRSKNIINSGISEALGYNWDEGYRHGECFIDVVDEGTSKFSDICGEKKSGIPSLLIWGDSHSASLYRGFEFFAKTDNYALYQFSSSGCPPILDFNVSNRKKCADSNKFVFNQIERLMPDTIILAAYWSMYNGADGWENLDINKLAKTISKLKLLNVKNIILIGHLPTFSGKQADLLRRRSFSDVVATRTYSNFMPIVNVYDNNIRDLAAITGIGFISPLDILCDANGCLISVPGEDIIPLSFDYGHLTTNGSKFLVSKFFELKLIKF